MNEGVTLQNSNCKADGGAVYMSGSENTAKFIMNGGEIKNNTVTETNPDASRLGGGAVFIHHGTFTMNNGKITGNSSKSVGQNAYGGAIMILDMEIEDGKSSSKFIMNGGEISGNSATDKGGAIWAQKDTEVELNAGKIIGNKAKEGGAIFVFPYTYKTGQNSNSKYDEIEYKLVEETGNDGKYDCLKISENMEFKDNKADVESEPPENYAEFGNLKFKSISVESGKSLLNNYDVNYINPNPKVELLLNENYDGGLIKKFELAKFEEVGKYLYYPTRDGYNFIGWNYKKDGSGEFVKEKDEISENKEIFAIWEKKNEPQPQPQPIPTVELTIDENNPDGKIKKYTLSKCEEVEKYLYEPKREGYKFIGWNYEIDGSGKLVKRTDLICSDTKIYANWQKLPDDWNYQFVLWNGENKKETKIETKIETEKHLAYIEGYEDNTIRPEGKITRAEAAALVLRLAEMEMLENESKFDDTLENAWYNKYINKAYVEGMLIAKENRIRPDEKITRAEFAKLIAKFEKEIKKEMPFEDTKDHEFESEINKAYSNGIIEGYPDGTFKPNAEIVRAEAVKMLNILFNRNADKKFVDENKILLKNYKDLDENHWGYYEMVEAINSHEFMRETNVENWVKLID